MKKKLFCEKYMFKTLVMLILCLMMSAGIVGMYSVGSAANEPRRFTPDGDFGVPVIDVNTPMTRAYDQHLSNKPQGIDLNVNKDTRIYAPFAGTVQYYSCSAIIDGRRQSVSYGQYLELTATINGKKLVFLLGHMEHFPKGYAPKTDVILSHDAYQVNQIPTQYHPDGSIVKIGRRSTSYGGLSGYLKEKVGDPHWVQEGQFLGTTGDCGYSSGDHAHIQLSVDGVNTDPDLYITNAFSARSRYTGPSGDEAIEPHKGEGTGSIGCGCYLSNAGIYQCTTENFPLSIRSGHGTCFDKIGNIPIGATVHVTAAGGAWAHVSYNGVSGYASTQYLKRVGDADGLFVHGSPIIYDNGSVFPSDKDFITANRQFADYCQNAVWGVNYSTSPQSFAVSKTYMNPNGGWTYVKKDGTIYTVVELDSLYTDLLSLTQDGNSYKVCFQVLEAGKAANLLKNNLDHIEIWNHTGMGGGGIGGDDILFETAMTPEIIVHIDRPAGKYDGSDHIEISGWIASRQQLTYVMGECEAFGQINLTDSLTDASAELDAAGYSAYPYKYRYRSVIDRKHLQPNTTYTMKVWAGMANGGTSAVCGQSFDVTSIEPTVIRHTKPSGSTLTGGKDVTVAGTIVSLNPITDAKAKLADINGSTQQLEFDLKLTANNALVSGSKYTYGYDFTGTLPMALVGASNTTATVFVTAIDQNHIQTTEPKTYTIGSVVRGDINSYEFVYDQDSVTVTGTGSQTLTGTVYANAPIADVMALIHKWDSESGLITIADVTETTPKSGYHYAKKFTLTISAGDLCDTLGVDSFVDTEFRVRFWCDLVSDSGAGVHKECAKEQRKVYGKGVSTNVYSVKYNANSGTGAPASQSVKHNKGLTLSSAVPTRTGCSFRGWATASGSNEVKYAPGGTYKTNKNVTLYAVWEKAADIPTNLISYDTTANITIKNAPKVFKLVPSAATKYRFTASGSAGANVVIQNASGTAVASLSGASSAMKEILLSDNQTYYIVVKTKSGATGSVKLNVLRSYAITFDACGGTGAPTDTLYQFAGESVTLPQTIPEMAPVVITYDAGEGTTPVTAESLPVTFDRWANYDFRSANFYLPGESVPFGRSLTLCAEWEYPLMGEIIVPEQEGKIFVCWEDENGVEADGDYLLLEDVTLYARWVDAIPLEGIKLTPKNVELEVGDAMQLTVSALPSGAILPGIVFTSSNPHCVTVSATGMVEVIAPGVSTILACSADGLFTASALITVGDPVFDVVYHLNGGEGEPPAAEVVVYGDAYALPALIPERAGHRFLGWADAPDASEPLYLAGESAVIERSLTFYAVWETETYPVVYDACGGSGAPQSQTKVYGEALTLSEGVPTRDHYYFEGWALRPLENRADYRPGDLYEANAPLTLYALWRAHATAVTLNYPVLVLTEGESKTIRAALSPADAAGGALLWASSNAQTASVSGGTITANAPGQATITCTVADNPALSALCRVTVVPASTGGDAPDAPSMQTLTARQGESVQLTVAFSSADAAYARLLYSYDASALTLTDVTVSGAHVTTGPNALVLAVASGTIPDGAQATLTFAVNPDAPTGPCPIDVAVAEAFTHEEAATTLHAAAADGVKIVCAEHQPQLLPPVPATPETDGLSAALSCAVCASVLEEPQPITRALFLPKGVKEIHAEALSGLTAQQIVLPEGTQSVAGRAFAGCHDLLLVIAPETAVFAPDAFEGCGTLWLLAPDGTVLRAPEQ